MGVIQPKKKQNLNNELKFRTTRVRVYVWIGKDPQPIAGYAFVNEVKKKAVAVYVSRKLPISDVVMVAFDREDAQPFRAKITGNESKQDKKTLQTHDSDWKTSLGFEFASEAEAKRYIEFYLELRQRTAQRARQVKQSNYSIVEGKGDGFDIDDTLEDLEIGGPSNKDKKGAA